MKQFAKHKRYLSSSSLKPLLLYHPHHMDDQLSPPPIKIIIDSPPTVTNLPHNQNPKHYSSILPKLHACHFTITLSLGAQALLWKTLIDHHTFYPRALHRVLPTLPSTTFHLLWYLILTTQITLSLLYFLKFIFNPNWVKSELSRHIGANYLFAPSTSWLVLLISSPFFAPKMTSCEILCWVFAIPLLILDVKIYGQWFTSEKRFLSVFANPTSQISVMGNLVVAWAVAEMGWREAAMCLFTIGVAHYFVVFVTLYQRLSGGCQVPARLRPVFFLFVAAPSVGSLAWKSISGTFDVACKMLFFLALFLFVCLACRPLFFKKSIKRFNVAWWAYSFPLSFLALASAEYAQQVNGLVATGLMLVLSSLSVVVFLCVMGFTALNTDLLVQEKDICFLPSSTGTKV